MSWVRNIHYIPPQSSFTADGFCAPPPLDAHLLFLHFLSPYRLQCFPTSALPLPSHLCTWPYPLLSPPGNHIPLIISLVNSSLSSDCFPSSFKRAHIILLLKKPTLDPSIIQNYRSVSLLPFLSKTIERAASNQLSSLFFQNSLFDPHQSGFRPGHSMETALLSVSESLHAAQAASLSSLLILLDLSAAFNTPSSCPVESVEPPWTRSSPTSLVAPSRLPGLVLYRHLGPLP